MTEELEPDTAPDATADAEAVADITDQEWRDCHEQLRGVIPDDELAYVWDPEHSAAELGIDGYDEPDEAEADDGRE